MITDPKMPEPAAYVDDLSRPQPHCVTSLKYCSVLQHQRGDHLRYIPVITTEAARLYAEALAAQRVAQERERCAKLCDDLEAAIWREYKDSTGASSHTEGRSDGAGECAAAIRKQPPETGKEK